MATGTPVTYKITAIVADTQYNSQNAPVTGRKVTYEVSNGYTDSVFISNADFGDMTMVKRRVEAEVRAVAAAYGLTGTVQG